MSTRIVQIAVAFAVALVIGVGAGAAVFAYQRNNEITSRQRDVADAFHIFICGDYVLGAPRRVRKCINP